MRYADAGGVRIAYDDQGPRVDRRKAAHGPSGGGLTPIGQGSRSVSQSSSFV